MKLKQSNRAIKALVVEAEYNKAMACYACCSDIQIQYDYDLWTNREVLLDYEVIDLFCVMNEICYRGLKCD